jgi:hypothetical protein
MNGFASVIAPVLMTLSPGRATSSIFWMIALELRRLL